MPLSQEEREQCRYHLGYSALTTAASIQFGVPALTQTNHLIESAMNHMLEISIGRIRRILVRLEDVETKLTDAQDHMAATQLEELSLRQDEADSLEREYRRWALRLSDILGAPINPYSQKFRGGGTNAVTMIPIRRDF